MRLISAYAGDSFWRGVEWSGRHNLAGGIMNRKLELVYAHWSVLLVFFAVTVLAVAVLIRRSSELRRIVPPWVAVCILLYCLIVGLFFFNKMSFTHAMLQWRWHMFVWSMLRSLVLAAIPVWLLYVAGTVHPEIAKVPGRLYLALIPILHSLMVVLYVLNPYCAIE
jgi:hypothetical protein